jgi:hypothetical protein
MRVLGVDVRGYLLTSRLLSTYVRDLRLSLFLGRPADERQLFAPPSSSRTTCMCGDMGMISNGRESPQGDERGPWAARKHGIAAAKVHQPGHSAWEFPPLSVWSLRPCVTGFDFCNLSVQAFVRAKRPEPAGREESQSGERLCCARAREQKHDRLHGRKVVWFQRKRATALRALSSSRGAVRVSGRCMLAKPKASDLFQSGRLLLVMLITWMLIDAYPSEHARDREP